MTSFCLFSSCVGRVAIFGMGLKVVIENKILKTEYIVFFHN